jgi:hypothetical protein
MTIRRLPLDSFAIEELRRRYLSADVLGRIAILQTDKLPFELARLAAGDPNIEVRQWFARNGRDYRELSEHAGRGFQFSEQDLLEILRKDPDPFVRACVYANPAFSPLLNVVTAGQGEGLGALLGIGTLIKTWWSEATHLERLGMVRGNSFDSQVLKLFVLKEDDSSLSVEERKELIYVFLAGRSGETTPRDSEIKGIWELVSEWPQDSDVPPAVYRSLPTSDHVAAHVYERTQNPEWRRAILQMVFEVKGNNPRKRNDYEYNNATLEQAIRDTNGLCRLLAYAAWRLDRPLEKGRERSARWRSLRHVADKDIYALAGLAKNSSLIPRELRWVERRVNALGDSLNDEPNLSVIDENGDELYTISEKDLRAEIHRNVQRRLSEIPFERKLLRFLGPAASVIDDEQAEYPLDKKLDYLTLLMLSTSWRLRLTFGFATGIGLILSFLAYILSHNLAIALFTLLTWSWLRTRIWPPIDLLQPWLWPDEYENQLKKHWSARLEPKKPPLIRERSALEVEKDREVKAHSYAAKFWKDKETRDQRLEAHKRDRETFSRKTRRAWYLLKRNLRFPSGWHK